jgi:hypothetical protein
MKFHSILRTLPAAVAIACAGLALNAAAQNANPTGPGPASANKAGEAYPNDPNAANPNKPKAEIVKKAENSKAAKATKRTTKKATNAVKSGASKTAAVVRDTGNKLNEKIPPGPNDPKK